MYPRSGCRSGGTSAKTTLLENHPFVNPPIACCAFLKGQFWAPWNHEPRKILLRTLCVDFRRFLALFFFVALVFLNIAR